MVRQGPYPQAHSQPFPSALRTLAHTPYRVSEGMGCRTGRKKVLLSPSKLTPCPLLQNAFWFCLAWCTFFLLPSVVFAIKTSKYFHPIWKRLR